MPITRTFGITCTCGNKFDYSFVCEANEAIKQTVRCPSCSLSILVDKPPKAAPVGGDWSFHYERGLDRIESEQFQGAVDDFDECIRVKPNDAHNYYNRARALVRLGEVERAVEDFETALAIDSKYGRAYYSRGVLNYHLGKEQLAIDDLKHAINWGGPACIADAHFALHKIYQRSGLKDLETKCFQQAMLMVGPGGLAALEDVYRSQLPPRKPT